MTTSDGMARQDREGVRLPAASTEAGTESDDDRSFGAWGHGAAEALGDSAGASLPELEHSCDPPAPPDYLERHLFVGADLDGCLPEDKLLALLDSARLPLRSLFKQLGIRVEDTEDLVQQALLIVVGRWKDVEDPVAYFLGTARNLGKMHKRRLEGERRLRIALSQMESSGGEVPQLRIERQLEARQLLGLLPEAWRRIIQMRFGEELSARDIAVALDCTPAGVRQSASRAVRRLRRLVAAELSERAEEE